MNLEIQQPSLLIKVIFYSKKDVPSYLKDEVSSIKNNIDFYQLTKFEINNVPEMTDNLWDEFNIELIDYFESIFKNDCRIISIKKYDDLLYLRFKTIDQSVDFYKTHFKILQMDFCAFSEFDESIIFMEQDNQQIPTSSPISNLVYSENTFDSKISETETVVKEFSSKTEFSARVEYFNNMKSIFSKTEVSKMTENVTNGNKSVLFLNTKELFVGTCSNMLIQNELKKMSEAEILSVIENLGIDIAPISATKYGAYSVQTLIINTKTHDNLAKISKNINFWGRHLITHTIGNYTIQRILIFDKVSIFKLFISHIKEILNDKLGMKVITRSLKYFNTDENSVLINKLCEVKTISNQKNCNIIESAIKKKYLV